MVTLRKPVHRGQALQAMADAGVSTAVLLDEHDHPLRWIDERALNSSERAIEAAGRPITVQVQPEDTLQDALSAMLTTSSGMAVVVDAQGRYLGGCTIESLAALLLTAGNGASPS
jgi:osmoprotectant transport system ATP-binding protein